MARPVSGDAAHEGVVLRTVAQPVDSRGVPITRRSVPLYAEGGGDDTLTQSSGATKRRRSWFRRENSTYWITRRIFLRAIGIVYFIAFWSLSGQILGLAGKDGIAPAADFLNRVHVLHGNSAYWRLPTLCWLNCSDRFLQSLCWGGMGLSILLVLGLVPIPVLILLWASYLSLINAGGVFLSFQWDILLLEAGFLAILFAPWTWRLRSPRAAPPSRIVLFLIRWLLFRLMFLSGIVKLTFGDSCWPQLTALKSHYETQPLPTWIGWYAHNMPEWFNALSTAIMFVIELVIPFFVFGSRRLRTIAFWAITGLMVIIGATGNYNFFNLLAVVLCLTLFDDRAWGRLIRGGFRVTPMLRPSWPRWGRWLRVTFLTPVAIVIVLISIREAWPSLRLRWQVSDADGTAARTWNWGHDALDRDSAPLRKVLDSAGVLTALDHIEPFRVANTYGLFRNMTKRRLEIVIEGSDDGWTWKEFELPWKPGDVMRRPGYCEPLQPRLDWQMWFAALGPREYSPWFTGLMQRILEGSPEVLALFEKNPFPTAAPRFVRAKLYDYHFTDPATLCRTGAWWRREYLGLFCPPMSNGK